MHQLASVQDAFADAVRDASMRVPLPIAGAARQTADRRFAVYRNNFAVSLVSALAARFPVVQRLVGEEFFRAMARAYVMQEPPRSPVLLHYGATFPAFVDGFEPAATIDYLGDVARLEFARGRAFHAADADPLTERDIASVPAAELADTRVVLHPSVSVVTSRHPIVSIWEAHRDSDAIVPVQAWAAETALVARPFLTVEVMRLPPGGGHFLTALARGLTITDAAETARAAERSFDLVANLALLFAARIVTGFGDPRPADRRSPPKSKHPKS
jgi:hypothetical protein